MILQYHRQLPVCIFSCQRRRFSVLRLISVEVTRFSISFQTAEKHREGVFRVRAPHREAGRGGLSLPLRPTRPHLRFHNLLSLCRIFVIYYYHSF